MKLDDFLIDIQIRKNFDTEAPPLLNKSTSSSYWKEGMTGTAFAKYFTFKAPKSITLNQEYCMTFVLVKNFTIIVYVHDEDFFFNTANPLGPPINYWTFPGISERNHYQELTLTKQTKLNLDRRPCNEDPDYSFTKCIKENVSKQVMQHEFYFKIRLAVSFLGMRPNIRKNWKHAPQASNSGSPTKSKRSKDFSPLGNLREFLLICQMCL